MADASGTTSAAPASTSTTGRGSGGAGSGPAPTTSGTTDPRGTTSTPDPDSSGGSTGRGEGTGSSSDSSGEPRDCIPIIVEALTGLSGNDDEREWVVLLNPCPDPVDLDAFILAWGDERGYDGTLDLVGTVPSGQCWVVGGPASDPSNADPVYDQAVNLNPNLDSGQGAVGLFTLNPMDIDVSEVPLDVVIYGSTNAPGYRDSTGAIVDPMLGNPPDNDSLRRTSAAPTWMFGDPPTPNVCPSF
ncbi:MAG: hypothetical protein K0V04_44965 [Deltaproteobacteria bacterium]|nr:hypothetical protein [Deltaproteobacteria bacterium]